MNGLSDVRLTLAQQGQPHDVSPRLLVGAAYAPAMSRWTILLRRLSTRRGLLKLNAQQLADIGLTRAEALREASLPFWKL
ncbi:DUF1127 domain-containing protein [uncultured Pseudomonas sp.]|uniref:DUF1127 domain-containing protein n=1 Tax=uncultured Pseudomonas sp. TaxID=114707 RepID=UPI002621B9A3|nr:DUF1127 domain-containing protein [uncultured Pseudomonas sp.]